MPRGVGERLSGHYRQVSVAQWKYVMSYQMSRRNITTVSALLYYGSTRSLMAVLFVPFGHLACKSVLVLI